MSWNRPWFTVCPKCGVWEMSFWHARAIRKIERHMRKRHG